MRVVTITRGSIGPIAEVSVGATFRDRRELASAGIHRPFQAGISGVASTGAESIVLSGGYEDDLDLGDEIVYTGQGGNDLNTRGQVADQELTRGNAALKTSCELGLPVRVVRGSGADSPYAPRAGYRYDGLYRVESYWSRQGRSGFRVWQFKLVRMVEGRPPPLPEPVTEPPVAPPRVASTVQRIVRNSAAAQRVKALYRNRCQVCGEGVPTVDGSYYAEGAHIRPLGVPHNGPDHEANILCLCPNHHARLDYGGMVIGPDWGVRATDGTILGSLHRDSSHAIGIDYIEYRLSITRMPESGR